VSPNYGAPVRPSTALPEPVTASKELSVRPRRVVPPTSLQCLRRQLAEGPPVRRRKPAQLMETVRAGNVRDLQPGVGHQQRRAHLIETLAAQIGDRRNPMTMGDAVVDVALGEGETSEVLTNTACQFHNGNPKQRGQAFNEKTLCRRGGIGDGDRCIGE
jgi:hypothetical protein